MTDLGLACLWVPSTAQVLSYSPLFTDSETCTVQEEHAHISYRRQFSGVWLIELSLTVGRLVLMWGFFQWLMLIAFYRRSLTKLASAINYNVESENDGRPCEFRSDSAGSSLRVMVGMC